jgi:hypothetical protein
MRTIAPDIESEGTESEEWLVLDREPADATREELKAHSFDPTQGRKIGSDPYDDPTQGRTIGSDPYDDPTQGRTIGSGPYDDPTQGRRVGSGPYDDPTQRRDLDLDREPDRPQETANATSS